jgi:hypothetical protein
MIVEVLLAAWNRISPNIIEVAWDLYDPSWRDDSSDSDESDEEYRYRPDFELESTQPKLSFP